MAKLTKNVGPKSEKKVIEIKWKGKEYCEAIDNFKLANITPMELKVALNEVSARFAFWGAVYSDVNKEIDQLKSDFDMWYITEYGNLAPNPKATETSKKNDIYLNNQKEVMEYHNTLNQLTAVKGKVKAVVDVYEMQSRTLQTIAAIIRQELAVLKSGGGSGSLLDE
jgi:hypothetical protein